MKDMENVTLEQKEKYEIAGALQLAMNHNGFFNRSIYEYDFDTLFKQFKNYEQIYEWEEHLEANKEVLSLASALKDAKLFGDFTSAVAFDAMCLLRRQDTKGNNHQYTLDEVYSKEMQWYSNGAKEALHTIFNIEELSETSFYDRVNALMTLCVYYQIDAINDSKKVENKRLEKGKGQSKNN